MLSQTVRIFSVVFLALIWMFGFDHSLSGAEGCHRGERTGCDQGEGVILSKVICCEIPVIITIKQG